MVEDEEEGGLSDLPAGAQPQAAAAAGGGATWGVGKWVATGPGGETDAAAAAWLVRILAGFLKENFCKMLSAEHKKLKYYTQN